MNNLGLNDIVAFASPSIRKLPPEAVTAYSTITVLLSKFIVLLVTVFVFVVKRIFAVSDKSVEAIVIFPVPSKDCPAIVLAVSKAVAVAALPS